MWGPLRGETLAPIHNALQMSVAEALQKYPAIDIALSDRPITGEENRWSPLLSRIPVLGDRFRRTMAPEDTRRPTMDLGIGIWTDRMSRYYPLKEISAAGNVIIDRFDNRTVVVAYPLDARAPTAFYLPVRAASWTEDTLIFDTGFRYADGRLYDVTGSPVELERPLQLFTRWYGYALTFPGTDIYGANQ